MRGCTRRSSPITCLPLLAVLALLCLPLSARPQDPPAAVAEARPIRFRVVIEAPRPYEKMLEEGLDLVRWQGEQRVTLPLLERLVAEARETTTEALAAEGYFSAQVKSRIEMTAPDEALVRIDVEPGPRTRVRDVDLKFRGPVLEDPEGRRRIGLIRETWGLKPGEPFRQEEWEAAKQAALARLARARYAAATIAESEALIDPEQRAAHLALKLDSGPIFRAGPTVVTGLRRYPASIIENLNPLRPGEPYDATKLDLFQRRLLELGYFNAVDFTIDSDPELAAAAPLRVGVIEAPSQRVEVGVEFSTDTRLGVTAQYSNVDFFDAAWRFRSALRFNAREQQLTVSLDAPPRPGAVWNTYTTRFERRDIQGQISREAIVGVARNWGVEVVPSQVSIAAHFERQIIAGAPTRDDNHAVVAGYRRTFRTTEQVVAPRRGFLGAVEVGASLPGLASQQFARARTRVHWLIPAGLRNDILLRGDAGVVLADSREGIPSSFLFRTGGDETVRGYAFESIGVPLGRAIVGGRYLVVGSAEYTRWVTDNLGAAVFVDAGEAFDDLDAFDLAVGIGAGVRWRSPIGPFRADIAYGERTKKPRFHFSVGYSF